MKKLFIFLLLVPSIVFSQTEGEGITFEKSCCETSSAFSCEEVFACEGWEDFLSDFIPENLDNDPANEIQNLSLSGCNLSISGVAGSIDICSILQTLEEDRCAGPFHRSVRDGWALGTWTPVENGNIGLTTLDWDNIGAARTSPDCVTDMIVSVDFGNYYTQIRRMRADIYIDARILINGAAVLTVNAIKRIHEDERNDTNPDVIPVQQYQTKHPGSYYYERLNVPAGATVQQQVRVRYRFVGAQTSAFGRIAPSLYPSVSYEFEPRNELTAVRLSAVEPFWILADDFGGLFYGIGEPEEGAEIFPEINSYKKGIEEAEEEAEKKLLSFTEEEEIKETKRQN